MRAMRMHGYGEPTVIRLDRIEQPAPGPGEVLIRVAATTFNPSEAGLRRGLLRSIVPVELPYTMGLDVAGTVAAVGPAAPAGGAATPAGGVAAPAGGVAAPAGGVAAPAGGAAGDSVGLAVGDRVIGRLDGGAAADYAVAPANVLVPVPAGVSLEDAAALPIAGLTAWQAVFEHAAVTAGQRVLVNGAGAIGRFAIQLARHAGAYVIAVATPRTMEAARAAGAHHVLPAGETGSGGLSPAGGSRPGPPGGAEIGPVDALIHLVPADPEHAALIRPGGVLVSATTPAGRLPAGRFRAAHFIVRHDTAGLAALLTLVEAGTVGIDIAGRRPLADLAAVHDEAETGRLAGKTLLLPGR
ncbi:NADP-dependent oxidoreductase [Actinoplanes sp. NEAU-A12]|uniref:NADP-dependent oxidoreductase n=1 Tax=Actinoplanes sandaracinus TaxID=3045177 RepID=A0ABT6WQ24_9ACTN|nr:NADP-dependent oxidoreductase [Actinoplanes sandaracinus]MDI6101827.1 NADP-dependent oxidoreductase [Actinoplanes sandaracinus]